MIKCILYPAVRDELSERAYQQVMTLIGKMMIIQDQVGIDHKHYMIGILGKGDDENTNRIISSLSKSKKLERKKRGISDKSSAANRSDAVRKSKRGYIDRRIPKSKQPLQHRYGHDLLKSKMTEMKSQQFRSCKKELPQQKNSKRSSMKKSAGINHQFSKTDEATQCDNQKDDKSYQNNTSSKTQLSMHSQHSLNLIANDKKQKNVADKRRFSAGAEISNHNSRYADVFFRLPQQNYLHSDLQTSAGEIPNKQAIPTLNETILQREQLASHFLKGPEIALDNKRDTIMMEQDERPDINPYFTVGENQIIVNGPSDIRADIIFNTPFLYMTNIQETNPPGNMSGRDIPMALRDENNN
uniref:AKAP7_NLS domain-containing protein n=1 Tax=Elaeophora elaphi TaxID=1147741 RepID=A0A0R3RFE5_9BILA